MNMKVGSDSQSHGANFTNVNAATDTKRPDGANLFGNKYTDTIQTSRETLIFLNQPAHNPRLNKPGDVPKDAPVQTPDAGQTPEDQGPDPIMQQLQKDENVKSELMRNPEYSVNGQFTNKGNKLYYAIMTGNTKGNPEAEAVMKAVTAKLGFEPPVDPAYINAKVGGDYEDAFLDLLKNLSPEEQKRMQYLFNMDPSNPDVKALIDKATAQMKAKWGDNVTLVTEKLTYSYKINGEYQFSLDESIKQMGPDLTQDQINQIKNYLTASPKPEISPEMKAIAEKANAAAIANVQALYGVPKSWVPDPSITLAALTNSPQGKAFLALSDQMTVATNLIAKLPASPEKLRLQDTLKMISKALSELREMLAIISAKDASESGDYSRAQIGLVQDKTNKMKDIQAKREAERAQQAEVAKKEAEQAKKNEWMQPLMIAAAVVLSVIAVVATAVTFGATAGLIALAITVLILVLTLVPSGQVDDKGKSLSLMGYMMDKLNKGIESLAGMIAEALPPGPGREALKQIIAMALRIAILVVAVIVSRGNLSVVAPLLLTFIVESGFIQKILEDTWKLCGGDKPPEWLAAAITAAIVVTIVLAIVLGKGGSGSLTKVGQLEKSGGTLAKISTALKAGSKTQVALQVGEGLAVGAQIAVNSYKAHTEFQMADLQKELAKRVRDTSDAESKIAGIEEMIKLLQKVIDSLFGQIQDLTDWSQETGRQMDQRWADKTELMTNLNAAQ